MIKNIIFDIGGVLAYFQWLELMRDLGFSQAAIDKLAKDMINDPLWNEFNRGTLSDEQFIEMFKEKNKGYEKEIDLFFEEKEKSILQYAYTNSMLASLKEQGYHLYYLSNYPASLFENHAEKRFSFFGYMEGGIVSAYVKMIKPEPGIYNELLTRYGLNPKECIFLDDMPDNIEGAKNVGIDGIVFKNYEQAMEELNKKLLH